MYAGRRRAKEVLMKELIAIQQELKAPKDLNNDFGGYKYRSCESILEAVKPLLKEHNCSLLLFDDIVECGGRVFVKATAQFSNGKDTINVTAFAREAESKKGMDVSQITGAASSYARKYALNGLFLIDDTKDADATNTHGKEEKVPNKGANVPKRDIEAELTACTTEEELKKVFLSLTAAQKKQYTKMKDELKKSILPF
jgi:hypothetical protein